MSNFLDYIDNNLGNAMNGLLETYKQVQGINMQRRLVNAQIRANDLDAAAFYSDPQAKAGSYAPAPASPMDGIPPWALLVGGGLALYLLIKD